MCYQFFIAFTVLCFFGEKNLAKDISAQTGFETTLGRLYLYQSYKSCQKPPPQKCPVVLKELIEDQTKDRGLIIKSRALVCHKALSSQNDEVKHEFQQAYEIQNRYESGRFNDLGEYSQSVVRSCVLKNSFQNTDQVSKFYYYAARLNQATSKLTQERNLISKILNTKAPPCPATDTLSAAYKVCEQSKLCRPNLDLKTLSASVQDDENIYNEILEKLKALPIKCEDDENCKKIQSAANISLVGLIQRNPWFLDKDFLKSKNKKNIDERIKKYLTGADSNLSDLQGKLQQTANCIHGLKSKPCDLDEMREALSKTPDLPEQFIKNNKLENQLTALMSYQSCSEEASLDRNRTGKIMTDTYLNMGLTVATVGLGALVNSARLAAAGAKGASARIALEGTNLSLNVFFAEQAYQDVSKSCGSDQLNFEFKNLENKQVCENNSSALSAARREQGACFISAGLGAASALILVPGGTRLFKLIQDAGYLNKSKIKIADEQIILSRKNDDIIEFNRIAIASSHDTANYTDMRQVLDYIMKCFGLSYDIEETEHKSFIEGRVGRAIVKGKKVAYLGEVSPVVLENWGLEMPVAALELNLTELFELVEK